MSDPYEEIVGGKKIGRPAPGMRHELICSRLHQSVQTGLDGISTSRLLSARSEIHFSHDTLLRPDLSLVTVASGKIWLAAEIIGTEDHRVDTVIKKQIYEDLKLPRLWMVDPRYDNVEIYHSTEHGLVLKGILAGKDVLTEKLLPTFHLPVAMLFASAA